ncbi:hypothetical protein D3C87_1771290 [compost metagenome]
MRSSLNFLNLNLCRTRSSRALSFLAPFMSPFCRLLITILPLRMIMLPLLEASLAPDFSRLLMPFTPAPAAFFTPAPAAPMLLFTAFPALFSPLPIALKPSSIASSTSPMASAVASAMAAGSIIFCQPWLR